MPTTSPLFALAVASYATKTRSTGTVGFSTLTHLSRWLLEKNTPFILLCNFAVGWEISQSGRLHTHSKMSCTTLKTLYPTRRPVPHAELRACMRRLPGSDGRSGMGALRRFGHRGHQGFVGAKNDES